MRREVHGECAKFTTRNAMATIGTTVTKSALRFMEMVLGGRLPHSFALNGQVDSVFRRGYDLGMPHEFTEWEYEPETQAASARGGGPPRNHTGVDVLDPLGPPQPPVRAENFWLRIFAAAVLLAAVAGLLMLLWSH